MVLRRSMAFLAERSALPTEVPATVSLDLLPVPAAVIAKTGSGLAFVARNAALRMTGLSTGEAMSPLLDALGAKIADFLAGDAPEWRFPWQVGDAIDSRYFTVHLARDEARCVLTLLDQTSGQRTEHSLRREMNTDALTGLPNRAGFGDLLDERINDGNRAEFAVLAINLDRFSRVNACMGALAGDELLISVARRLKGALRARDTLARTGGDEFAVLLAIAEGTSDAFQVAERICGALTSPFRLSDFEIRVDCSIGIALGGDAADQTEDLIRHAQFAVKRSKASGRPELYQAHAFDIVRTQFSIETELRHAIDGGDLRLAFQPIWSLSSGAITGFEALARWPRADGPEVMPADFIPVAEEAGLILPLGRWAMEEAARTLADWDAAVGGNAGVSVAVNLSAVQLQRDRVAPMLDDVLRRHGLAADRFTLELTESAIVVDPERAAAAMHTLKELGTTLAMDDFGTGYSNIATLQKLPIDVLKIDRSFVTDMLTDRDKVAIVRAMLGLGQALNMRITAEGIETQALEHTLAALGCDYGQGYLCSPPLFGDAALQLLRDRQASAAESARALTRSASGNPSAIH